MNKNIPENWDRDHWSTFAYIETLAVDNNGIAIPNITKMRTHIHNANKFNNVISGDKYFTLLRDGTKIEKHDDWDCCDDLVKYGLLINVSDDKRVAYSLTPEGRKCINKLREHMCNDNTFKTFNYVF